MWWSFSSGVVTMGFLIAGLFFLRFWKGTRDSFFLWFAAAFALFGIGQAALTFINAPAIDPPAEELSPLYLFRLAGYLLIIVAIWRKNIRARRS